jgi:hypothetical protein
MEKTWQCQRRPTSAASRRPTIALRNTLSPTSLSASICAAAAVCPQVSASTQSLYTTSHTRRCTNVPSWRRARTASRPCGAQPPRAGQCTPTPEVKATALHSEWTHLGARLGHGLGKTARRLPQRRARRPPPSARALPMHDGARCWCRYGSFLPHRDAPRCLIACRLNARSKP